MSAALAVERRRRVTFALILAGVLALAAYGVSALDQNSLKPPTASGPVLPNFASLAGGARAINIVTKDAAYHIVRGDSGWTLRDRGDYPVRRERLAQFTEALTTLAYVRPMTRDPAKHDRLALGDPAKGGEGVLVEVQDQKGALIANLVLGITPNGLYMRAPGAPQTWAVKGDLPPLKDPAQWLDLAPLAIDSARIASVSIQPVAGPAYEIARVGGAFALAKPFDSVATRRDAVRAAAEAFAQLRPIDVVGAPAIDGPVRARAQMRTADGLTLQGEVFEQGGRRWLKLVAHGDTPGATQEAQAINARAAAWAYGLSALNAADFAPPLAELLAAPAAPAAAPPTP
jgi:Domain of unknown function (DUF4340)